MNVRQISRDDLDAALADINERYDGNIEFVYVSPEGTGFAFRITAIDSRGPGSALSGSWSRLKDGSRRRTGSACWHAHGYLFEAIFERSPESWVTTGAVRGGRIDINGGNWVDYNRGSMMYPAYASELCECYELGIE